MKIFGYKTRLPVRHLNDSHSDPDAISIFPEEDICEACHLYKDRSGNTYVGFDLSLNLPENIMCELLEFIESDELAIYEVMDS